MQQNTRLRAAPSEPDAIPAQQPSIDNIEAESDNLPQTIFDWGWNNGITLLESQSDDLFNEVIEPYATRQAEIERLARIEELEAMLQYNGSFIGDVGARKEGWTHHSLIEARLAELRNRSESE